MPPTNRPGASLWLRVELVLHAPHQVQGRDRPPHVDGLLHLGWCVDDDRRPLVPRTRRRAAGPRPPPPVLRRRPPRTARRSRPIRAPPHQPRGRSAARRAAPRARRSASARSPRAATGTTTSRPARSRRPRRARRAAARVVRTRPSTPSAFPPSSTVTVARPIDGLVDLHRGRHHLRVDDGLHRVVRRGRVVDLDPDPPLHRGVSGWSRNNASVTTREGAERSDQSLPRS